MSNIFRDLGEKYIINFAWLLSFRRYRSLIFLFQSGDRLLRAFANLARGSKKNREIWRKLRLVVIHSSEVYVPLSANKSPFNLGLRPFNRDQVQDWAKRQGQDLSGEDAQQLTGFVNRNTYLVRVAVYHIGRGDVTERASVAQLSHLGRNLWRDRLQGLLWNLQQPTDLLAAFV